VSATAASAAAGAGRIAPAAQAPYVDSDVAELRSVLLHRPGDELRAVDADPRRALFAHAVDPAQAAAEHDAFAAALGGHGVEVLYVEQLVAEVLADATRRETFLHLALPGPAAMTRRAVAALPPGAAARALIGGDAGLGLDPLPNLMFTRDQSVWIGRGAVVGAMATRARARESRLLAAVHAVHPRFCAAPRWSDAASAQPRVEGGDVMALGDGRVMVAISQRTPRTGAHRLARALLAAAAADEVIVVGLPDAAGFHLDLALTLVDDDAVAVWSPARRALRATALRATPTGVVAHPMRDPLHWAARVIEIGGERPAAHGRAWDRGVNVLALRPGTVIAYEDNVEANERLDAAGVTVIPIAGAALGAGRGGPHCLSCPLVREPAPDSRRWTAQAA